MKKIVFLLLLSDFLFAQHNHGESPGVYGHKIQFEKWNFTFQENAFVRYTSQNFNNKNKRGSQDALDAPNWIMTEMQRKFGAKSTLSFHSMFSLEPLTEGGKGYPLLFQTGETFNDVPLVDRQHPHDLFSQFALDYRQSITSDIDINAYFGYPGEPALGPAVFMHRPSAINNPDAPLGHHWQDATHITFGTGAIGIRFKKVKAEGSIFTGREPDEKRFNFDEPKFDSYSWRISADVNENFALQFSQGFLHSPEALNPGEDVIRTTASVLHSQIINLESFVANAVIYGMNDANKKMQHSILLESNFSNHFFSFYGRYEWVQKSARELLLPEKFVDDIFNINCLSLGINRKLFTYFQTNFFLGGQATLSITPDELAGLYGETPLSGEVYVRLFPVFMHTHHKDKHSH